MKIEPEKNSIPRKNKLITTPSFSILNEVAKSTTMKMLKLLRSRKQNNPIQMYHLIG